MEDAFNSKFGLFEWLAIPFGFENTLDTFMRLINDVFKKNLGNCVVTYLADILVFNKFGADHLQHICANIDT